MAQVRRKAGDPERAERRRSPRHRLCLDAEAEFARGSTAPVIVHELSQTGFLLETAAPLGVGDALQLCLPQEEGIAARVVWSCGQHYGCEFQRRLSTAALSAALLKARPAREGEGIPRRLRLEGARSEANVVSEATNALNGQLPLIFGLSVLLWTVLAAAFLFSS